MVSAPSETEKLGSILKSETLLLCCCCKMGKKGVRSRRRPRAVQAAPLTEEDDHDGDTKGKDIERRADKIRRGEFERPRYNPSSGLFKWDEQDELEYHRREAYLEAVTLKIGLLMLLGFISTCQAVYLQVMVDDKPRVCVPIGGTDFKDCLEGDEAHNVFVNAGQSNYQTKNGLLLLYICMTVGVDVVALFIVLFVPQICIGMRQKFSNLLTLTDEHFEQQDSMAGRFGRAFMDFVCSMQLSFILLCQPIFDGAVNNDPHKENRWDYLIGVFFAGLCAYFGCIMVLTAYRAIQWIDRMEKLVKTDINADQTLNADMGLSELELSAMGANLSAAADDDDGKKPVGWAAVAAGKKDDGDDGDDGGAAAAAEDIAGGGEDRDNQDHDNQDHDNQEQEQGATGEREDQDSNAEDANGGSSLRQRKGAGLQATSRKARIKKQVQAMKRAIDEQLAFEAEERDDGENEAAEQQDQQEQPAEEAGDETSTIDAPTDDHGEHDVVADTKVDEEPPGGANLRADSPAVSDSLQPDLSMRPSMDGMGMSNFELAAMESLLATEGGQQQEQQEQEEQQEEQEEQQEQQEQQDQRQRNQEAEKGDATAGSSTVAHPKKRRSSHRRRVSFHESVKGSSSEGLGDGTETKSDGGNGKKDAEEEEEDDEDRAAGGKGEGPGEQRPDDEEVNVHEVADHLDYVRKQGRQVDSALDSYEQGLWAVANLAGDDDEDDEEERSTPEALRGPLVIGSPIGSPLRGSPLQESEAGPQLSPTQLWAEEKAPAKRGGGGGGHQGNATGGEGKGGGGSSGSAAGPAAATVESGAAVRQRYEEARARRKAMLKERIRVMLRSKAGGGRGRPVANSTPPQQQPPQQQPPLPPPPPPSPPVTPASTASPGLDATPSPPPSTQLSQDELSLLESIGLSQAELDGMMLFGSD